MSEDVCLFAHFDPQAIIAPHVSHYLRQLSQCGLKIHMAFSGHDHVPEDVQSFCDQLNIKVYPRPNKGLDFGAWQYLIEQGCIENARTITFANDSVFGPFYPLPPLFKAMQDLNRDVWGMVETRERTWHLQSWFICIKREAFLLPAFQRVFALPFTSMNKKEIILHGELGLGVAIQSSQLSWASCWYSQRRGIRKFIPMNPMQIDWLSVIKSHYVPFMKVELLRDNPLRIFWLYRWPSIIKPYQPFFAISWIESYLKTHRHRSIEVRKRPLRFLKYLVLSRDKSAIMRSLFHRRR